MYKVYSITIKGKEKHWNFTFWADSDFVNDWIDDGLEINDVILPEESFFNSIEKFIEALRNSS